jgi:DNA-binding transcriptional LysR family regulator
VNRVDAELGGDGRQNRRPPRQLNLVERAAAILAEIGKIRTETVAELTGPIRIGFAEGFAMVCLAPLMNALRRDYPALRPEYIVATSSTLERDMSAHRLDLAFLVNPVGQPGVRMQPLGGQPTVWTAATSLNIGPRIRPADLRAVPIITNPPPSAMHRQIMAWFATAGIEPARLDFCSSVTMVAHLVASGVGVGLLPLKMIEPQIVSGTLVALAGSPDVEHGRVFAAFWEGGHTPTVEAVIRCTRGVLEKMDYLVMDDLP